MTDNGEQTAMEVLLIFGDDAIINEIKRSDFPSPEVRYEIHWVDEKANKVITPIVFNEAELTDMTVVIMLRDTQQERDAVIHERFVEKMKKAKEDYDGRFRID